MYAFFGEIVKLYYNYYTVYYLKNNGQFIDVISRLNEVFCAQPNAQWLFSYGFFEFLEIPNFDSCTDVTPIKITKSTDVEYTFDIDCEIFRSPDYPDDIIYFSTQNFNVCGVNFYALLEQNVGLMCGISLLEISA